MASPARSYSTFSIDGQAFERISEEAHKTQGGRIAVITTWRSQCADCDAAFDQTSPQKPGPMTPTRRCRACVQPGKKHPVKATLVARRRKPTGVAIDCYPEMAIETHAIDVGRDAMRLNKVLEGALRRSVRVDAHATRPTTPHKPDVFTDR